MTDIAFLGLGIMGRGMARNLARAGHRVTAWNRTRRPLPEGMPTAGFAIAATLAEAVAAASGVVMLCVAGPDAQRALMEGDGGLIALVPGGWRVADLTTTDPALSRSFAERFAGRGVSYLDCPVFGSRNEAWNGELDIVCGGARDAWEAMRPLLQPMAKTVHYLGASGAGATMKLIGNLMVAAQIIALGEGLSLARKAGLPKDAVMGALDVVDFSSPLIRGIGRASFADQFEPFFYLKHMLKDARLIEALGRDLAVPLPSAAAAAEAFQGAVNLGFGDLNASAVHKLMFRLAGLPEPSA